MTQVVSPTAGAEDVMARLKEWIARHNKAAKDMSLDTDIIGSRLIDSLNFVAFLLFVEELRGQEIPEEQVSFDNFRSLRLIHDHFFARR